MMLAVWFAYGPDSPCLIESVAAFRAAAPGTPVAIIDQADNPVSPAALDLIKPDHYRLTDFPRGRSLNGWSCVLGMLRTFRELLAETRAGGVLKIDCDTLIFSLGWLDSLAPHCGIIGGRAATAYGMAYYLRDDAVTELLASIENRWLDPAYPAPEDQVISTEALMLYGPRCRLWKWDAGIAAGWQFDGIDPALDGRAVLNFGNRHLIPADGCPESRRELAAVEMARYRTYRANLQPRTGPAPVTVRCGTGLGNRVAALANGLSRFPIIRFPWRVNRHCPLPWEEVFPQGVPGVEFENLPGPPPMPTHWDGIPCLDWAAAADPGRAADAYRLIIRSMVGTVGTSHRVAVFGRFHRAPKTDPVVLAAAAIAAAAEAGTREVFVLTDRHRDAIADHLRAAHLTPILPQSPALTSDLSRDPETLRLFINDWRTLLAARHIIALDGPSSLLHPARAIGRRITYASPLPPPCKTTAATQQSPGLF